jgi:hypothetical protein
MFWEKSWHRCRKDCTTNAWITDNQNTAVVERRYGLLRALHISRDDEETQNILKVVGQAL